MNSGTAASESAALMVVRDGSSGFCAVEHAMDELSRALAAGMLPALHAGRLLDEEGGWLLVELDWCC